MISENRFKKDGIHYHAKEEQTATCRGCAFRDYLDCDFLNMPRCNRIERQDGRAIVWVRDDESEPISKRK